MNIVHVSATVKMRKKTINEEKPSISIVTWLNQLRIRMTFAVCFGKLLVDVYFQLSVYKKMGSRPATEAF